MKGKVKLQRVTAHVEEIHEKAGGNSSVRPNIPLKYVFADHASCASRSIDEDFSYGEAGSPGQLFGGEFDTLSVHSVGGQPSFGSGDNTTNLDNGSINNVDREVNPPESGAGAENDYNRVNAGAPADPSPTRGSSAGDGTEYEQPPREGQSIPDPPATNNESHDNSDDSGKRDSTITGDTGTSDGSVDKTDSPEGDSPPSPQSRTTTTQNPEKVSSTDDDYGAGGGNPSELDKPVDKKSSSGADGSTAGGADTQDKLGGDTVAGNPSEHLGSPGSGAPGEENSFAGGDSTGSAANTNASEAEVAPAAAVGNASWDSKIGGTKYDEYEE